MTEPTIDGVAISRLIHRRNVKKAEPVLHVDRVWLSGEPVKLVKAEPAAPTRAEQIAKLESEMNQAHSEIQELAKRVDERYAQRVAELVTKIAKARNVSEQNQLFDLLVFMLDGDREQAAKLLKGEMR